MHKGSYLKKVTPLFEEDSADNIARLRFVKKNRRTLPLRSRSFEQISKENASEEIFNEKKSHPPSFAFEEKNSDNRISSKHHILDPNSIRPSSSFETPSLSLSEPPYSSQETYDLHPQTFHHKAGQKNPPFSHIPARKAPLEKKVRAKRHTNILKSVRNERITITMNKLTIGGIIIGMMVLGLVFFISGFMIGIVARYNTSPSSPHAVSYWNQNAQAIPESQAPEKPGILKKIFNNHLNARKNALLERQSTHALTSVTPALQPFAQYGMDQGRMSVDRAYRQSSNQGRRTSSWQQQNQSQQQPSAYYNSQKKPAPLPYR
jgi:hypothetical protein